MGFSLQDIKRILDSPTYNLRESLVIQKAALKEQMERLGQACEAIDRALEMAADYDEPEMDTETVRTIIRGVTLNDDARVLQGYYGETAWAGIQLRSLQFTAEQQEQAERDWADIFDALKDVKHLPPEHDSVQAVVAKMYDLVKQFTGGDAEVLAGLKRFSADTYAGKLPPEYQGHTPLENMDDDLRDLVAKAQVIYEKRQKHEH